MFELKGRLCILPDQSLPPCDPTAASTFGDRSKHWSLIALVAHFHFFSQINRGSTLQITVLGIGMAQLAAESIDF